MLSFLPDDGTGPGRWHDGKWYSGGSRGAPPPETGKGAAYAGAWLATNALEELAPWGALHVRSLPRDPASVTGSMVASRGEPLWEWGPSGAKHPILSTRILGRRTAPFSPFLIPNRVPHGVTPIS